MRVLRNGHGMHDLEFGNLAFQDFDFEFEFEFDSAWSTHGALSVALQVLHQKQDTIHDERNEQIIWFDLYAVFTVREVSKGGMKWIEWN